MELNYNELLFGLLGGLLIGLSVTLMLLFKGRVTGISGILNGLLFLKKGDWDWRAYFIGGLVLGGFLLRIFYPSSLSIDFNRTYFHLIIAGLFVGFGTLLGNGCTSGHGVCGISRLSIRSITATLTFIAFGVLANYIMQVFIIGGN